MRKRLFFDLHLNVKKQKAASSVSPVIGASLVNFVKTSTEVLPTPEIKVVAVKKSPWLIGLKKVKLSQEIVATLPLVCLMAQVPEL